MDLIGVPITFDGGPGNDLMIMDGTPATPVVTTTYTPGPDVTEGRLTYDTNMTIDFVNLEPVVDLIPAASLVVNGTNADNAIDYRVGQFTGPPANPLNPLGLVTGRVSVDGFETIEFADKANLTLNGNAGDDVISLNYGTAPSLLTSITVNWQQPDGQRHGHRQRHGWGRRDRGQFANQRRRGRHRCPARPGHGHDDRALGDQWPRWKRLAASRWRWPLCSHAR